VHRFFIPPEWIHQEKVVITGKLVHQLRNVLRLSGGDHIVVLDNTGWEYEVALKVVARGYVEGVVRGKRSVGEPSIKVNLYQALLKGNKFEFILQKCTELGVSGFVPILCERCVVGHPKVKRVERWHRIISEAAEQSRRGKLPTLEPALTFQQACRSAMGFSLLSWVCDLRYEARFIDKGLYQQEIHCRLTSSSALREGSLILRWNLPRIVAFFPLAWGAGCCGRVLQA
jgi:RsmE family RNA methyltransferase